MEAKFYKDYKHNYMVLRCRQAVFLDTYSYKMLSMGKAQGLLKCSTRYMNNEAYLYYEIILPYHCTKCTSIRKWGMSR